MNIGEKITIDSGASVTDSYSRVDRVLTDRLSGIIDGYMSRDKYVVVAGKERLFVHGNDLSSDSPEARLARLVYGGDENAIAVDEASGIKVKSEQGLGGRVTTPIENALMVFVTSPHLRAVLKVIDKNALAQAENALAREGWLEGTEWPQDMLSDRQKIARSLGKMMVEVGKKAAFWNGVSQNPSSHPQYDDISILGDTGIIEFAMRQTERFDAQRGITLELGISLGISEHEMFAQEENTLCAED